MREPGAERSELRRALREEALPRIPAWLETRRWFSDKGRGIASVRFDDIEMDRADGEWLALTILHIDFAAGGEARYVLPLALTREPEVAASIMTLASGEAVVDATERPWFGPWALDRLVGRDGAPADAWHFSSAEDAAPLIAAAREEPAALVRAEQSNSSIRFDDLLMIKVFRRLQPGPNPDEEILRALAAAGFARVPRYAGAALWWSPNGIAYPAALALAFVPNVGDGWSWLLRRLGEITWGEDAVPPDPFAAERLLGRRTGELHVALSQIDDPDFLPLPQDEAGVAENEGRVATAIEGAAELLREHASRFPVQLRSSLPEAISGLRALGEVASGFRDELGLPRIRVHGDYHLGQTLRTPDGDWVIIDFEGEPARPVAERRQRWSPLKDVAGMLRSFAYARGAADRAAHPRLSIEARQRLADWEAGARRAFLESYRDAVGAAPTALVPANDDAFARALRAWELDKALYEIAYEARNRPDWLELPLRTLLPTLGDQPAAETGAAPA
jgi:trehalose synthase-fused probable maltokinase